MLENHIDCLTSASNVPIFARPKKRFTDLSHQFRKNLRDDQGFEVGLGREQYRDDLTERDSN